MHSDVVYGAEFLLCGRFTGVEFPPKIVFKVFISTGGVGIKYLSGKKVIVPASEVRTISKDS